MTIETFKEGSESSSHLLEIMKTLSGSSNGITGLDYLRRQVDF